MDEMRKHNFLYPLLFILVWLAIFTSNGFSYERDSPGCGGSFSKTNTLAYDYWEFRLAPCIYDCDITLTNGECYSCPCIYNVSISSNSTIDILLYSRFSDSLGSPNYPNRSPKSTGSKLNTVNFSFVYESTTNSYLYIDNTNDNAGGANYSGDVVVTVIIFSECNLPPDISNNPKIIGYFLPIIFLVAIASIIISLRKLKRRGEWHSL